MAAMPELPRNGLASARLCLDQRRPVAVPDQIRAIARRTSAFADDLLRVKTAIVDGSDCDMWTGKARDDFRSALQHNLPRLDTTVTRYQSYARALDGYACTLDGVLPEINRSRYLIESGLAEAMSAGKAAPITGCASLGATALAPPDPHNELLPLAWRFKSSYDEWASALDRCSAALLRANAADALHDPRGAAAVLRGLEKVTAPIWQVVNDPTSARAWSQCLGAVGSALTAIGIGLLVVCPAAGGIALAAAAVISAAQLAVDGYRKFGPGHEQVSVLDLGMDVAGAVPFVGLTKAGAAAVKAGLPAASAAAGRIAPKLEAFARAAGPELRVGVKVAFKEHVAPLRNGLPRPPSNSYRTIDPAQGGKAGLLRRWAQPALWDAPNAYLQWPDDNLPMHRTANNVPQLLGRLIPSGPLARRALPSLA